MPILVVPAGVVNCKIETGSLVFAIFNCIITGVAVVACITWVLPALIMDHYFEDKSFKVKLLIVKAILLCIISFIYSIVLTKGLLQKRPTYLRSYVRFGVGILVVCAVVSVCLFVMAYDGNDWKLEHTLVPIATAVLCTSIVYSAILLMIWATYKQLVDATQQTNLVFTTME